MTRKEYLYSVLSEEAAEVIQAVSKVLRFGETAYNPADEKKKTNETALIEEVQHLTAAIEMLQDEGYLTTSHLHSDLDTMKYNKRIRVRDYLDKYLSYIENKDMSEGE